MLAMGHGVTPRTKQTQAPDGSSCVALAEGFELYPSLLEIKHVLQGLGLHDLVRVELPKAYLLSSILLQAPGQAGNVAPESPGDGETWQRALNERYCGSRGQCWCCGRLCASAASQ